MKFQEIHGLPPATQKYQWIYSVRQCIWKPQNLKFHEFHWNRGIWGIFMASLHFHEIPWNSIISMKITGMWWNGCVSAPMCGFTLFPCTIWGVLGPLEPPEPEITKKPYFMGNYIISMILAYFIKKKYPIIVNFRFSGPREPPKHLKYCNETKLFLQWRGNGTHFWYFQ